MTTFERIKELAKQQGISLSKLNDAAGLGTNSIYHWKTKTPSTESLSKVADALHVSVDYLLGNTDNPSPTRSPDKAPAKVDLKKEIQKSDVLSWGGREISNEELEFIRRILDGGDGSK